MDESLWLLQGIKFIKEKLQDDEVLENINKEFGIFINPDEELDCKLKKLKSKYFEIDEKYLWSDYYNDYVFFTKDMMKMKLADSIAGVRYRSILILIFEKYEEYIDCII